MTLIELKEKLEETGMPVSFSHFKERTDPPFITYITPGSDNFFADGTIYLENTIVRIELYTRLKDPESEEKVKQALRDFTYNWDQEYIDSEKVFMTTYEIEV